MHDPGPVGLPAPLLGQPGELGVKGQEARDERAGTVRRIGMDHDAGWLVHHDHCLVVVDDTEADLSRRGRPQEAGAGHGAEPEVDLQEIAGPDPLAAGRDDGAADADRPGGYEPRHLCPRVPGQEGNEPVHALAREHARDDHDRACAGVAHRSGPRPACSGRPPATGAFVVAAVRHNATASTAQPQTIAASARLKVGQNPERRKSTTAPW